MNILERTIYHLLKRNPVLKTGVRNLYQKLFDFIPTKDVRAKHPITVREGFFFGFHDHSPFSADNQMMLANRYHIPLQMPDGTDPLETGYFHGENWEAFKSTDHTFAWNWHQGCKLQWIGDTSQYIFNDHRNGKTFARTGETGSSAGKELPEAISSVSPDGRYAVGFSFERLERYMPGYGYPQKTGEPEIDKPVTDKSGLFVVDINQGSVRKLFSVADLAETEPQDSMKGASHFFSHALFAPSGNRLVFLHRWVKGDIRNRFSRLISVDTEGRGFHIFPPREMVSHFGWKNHEEILAYCRIGKRDGYFLLRDKTEEFREIGAGRFTMDGHPSFSPDGQQIITDTYPDRTRRASLLKYDIEDDRLEKLAYLKMPSEFQSPDPWHHWQCDLHPRWDRSGLVVSFDSTHTGRRALCTMHV